MRVSYFQIAAPSEDARRLSHALLEIGTLPVARRERTLTQGALFRLERIEEQDRFVLGDFTRRQMTDIPPEAQEHGLAELNLQEGSGLGRSSAFLIDEESGCLALEMRRGAASAGRVLEYLRCFEEGLQIGLAPHLSSGAWARFDSGQPRQLRFRVASAPNLDRVASAEEVGLIETLIAQRNALGAPQITVEISVGRDRNRSLLFGGVRRLIDTLASAKARGDLDVTDLRAVTKPDDGGASETIDFLEEFMSDHESLDLPRDPENSYIVRRDFVRRCYVTRKDRGDFGR